MTTRESIGVVIGRFQVDKLHAGHKALLDYVASIHHRMLILIGFGDTPPTKTNPLTFEVRERMLREVCPHAIILPIQDARYNETWSKRVDTAIFQAFGRTSAILYSGRDGFESAYKGKYPVQIFHSPVEDISASDIREEIRITPEHDMMFRRGIIYAMENLPHRIYLTVDIALIKTERTGETERLMILMVKKPDETMWRLPGGFIEPGESFAKAGARELFEETELLPAGTLEYVGDFPIDDWRIRNAQGVSHKTILLTGRYSHGHPKGKDDVAEADWIELTKLGNIIPVMEEHKIQISAIQRHYNVWPLKFDAEENIVH